MVDYVRADKLFYGHMKTAAGSELMNVNGTTPVTFRVTNNNNTGSLIIARLNFSIVDAGIGYGEFGGLTTALTNGLLLAVYDSSDTLLLDFLDGAPIKTNEQFAELAGVDAASIPAAGDDAFPIRFTIARTGKYLLLENNNYIQMTVRDNLTGLSHFQCMAQGYYL